MKFDTPNYQGPGIYRHYKGGVYVVVGFVRLEWNEGLGVAYMTTDPEHREQHFYKGALFTVRPLEASDGPDAFNDIVDVNGIPTRRFERLDQGVEFVAGSGVNF